MDKTQQKPQHKPNQANLPKSTMSRKNQYSIFRWKIGKCCGVLVEHNAILLF